MPIGVACQCGQQFDAKDHLAGKTVGCPTCGQPLQIPHPRSAPGASELSVEQLMNLEASSPALGGPQGVPGAGPPGMGAAGGVPGQGFPAQGLTGQGFPGQAPGGFPGAPGAFQGYAPQAAQQAGGGGMGKGAVIALCAGGGFLLLLVVGTMLVMALGDDESAVAQGDGKGAPAATSDGGGGPGPAGNPPAANAPTGNIPGGNGPSGNAPTGKIPSGNVPTGNTSGGSPPQTGRFVVADFFSVETPAGFGWKHLNRVGEGAASGELYACTKEGSNTRLALIIARQEVREQLQRRVFVAAHYTLVRQLLDEAGASDVQDQEPGLTTSVPDQLSCTFAYSGPDGEQRFARSLTLFRKNTYLLLVLAATDSEASRLASIGSSIEDLGNGGGAPSIAASSGGLPLAVNKYFDRSGPLRGLRPFVEKGKPAQDNPQAGFSWMCELLPYLGHDAVYKRLNFKVSWESDPNRSAACTVIPEFLSPAEPRKTWKGFPLDGLALTHFVGMSGVETAGNDVAARYPRSDDRAGMFGYAQIAKRDQVTDGLSQTIMMLGVAGKIAQPWIVGGGGSIRGAREPYFDARSGFQMTGQTGTVALMADGSVRAIPATVDGKVFRALCTIHGKDTVDVSGLELKPDFFPGK